MSVSFTGPLKINDASFQDPWAKDQRFDTVQFARLSTT